LIISLSVLLSAYILVRLSLGDVWGDYADDFKEEFDKIGTPSADISIGELTDIEDINDAAEEFGAKVHFIDVGQGDAALIQTENHNILIDAGENGHEDELLAYLKEQNVETIHLIVATHPHSDHLGGVEEVIETLDVKKIWMPKIPEELTPTNSTFKYTLEAIETQQVKASYAYPGDTYFCDEGLISVLGPVWNAQYESLNNYSIVLTFHFDGITFLFTGDMEKEAEYDLLDAGENLSAHVLKVGHHGSSTSSSEEFLNAVDPDYCVISLGEGNDYGHPHWEVREALEVRGLTTFRTDQNGSVVFSINDNGLHISTER